MDNKKELTDEELANGVGGTNTSFVLEEGSKEYEHHIYTDDDPNFKPNFNKNN